MRDAAIILRYIPIKSSSLQAVGGGAGTRGGGAEGAGGED